MERFGLCCKKKSTIKGSVSISKKIAYNHEGCYSECVHWDIALCAPLLLRALATRGHIGITSEIRETKNITKAHLMKTKKKGRAPFLHLLTEAYESVQASWPSAREASAYNDLYTLVEFM